MSLYYDVRVCDCAIGPNNSVYAKGQGSKRRYKVDIYLEGRDLPYVYAATYHLHPTFEERQWTVRRRPSNPECRLTIWTWGVFTVHVEIELKSAELIRMRHRLSYDELFQYVRRDEMHTQLADGSVRYRYEPPKISAAGSNARS